MTEQNPDRKGRASAFFALNLEPAAHQIDYFFGNGHSDSASAIPVGGSGILLDKGFKQPGYERGVHPYTGIHHRKAQFSLILPVRLLHCKSDGSRRIGKLDGISEYVDQDLLKPQVIAQEIFIR